ncbi:MAG: preprotein translocase subunit SecE [Planctomycetota bacterium]|nr:MAG: preprotein translocase subunit SecE [Planctomycetota bacterium]
MSDGLVTEPGGQEEPKRPTEPRPARVGAAPGGFGLRIYKHGQGFYTRVGTAVGFGVLIVAGTVFLFNELGGCLKQDTDYFLPVQYGISTAFMLLMGILIYWLVGLSRKVNDFFIATEGEMKKVSWSTRKEIIRSTKVVIVAVLLLGIFLFLADIMFMLFFSTIKVLKGPGIERFFGSGT